MRQDLLLDDTGDLIIRNGDFVIGDSDDQHCKIIMNSAPGNFFWKPKLGANVKKFLNTRKIANMKRAITEHLFEDGYKLEPNGFYVKDLTEGEIYIKPKPINDTYGK